MGLVFQWDIKISLFHSNETTLLLSFLLSKLYFLITIINGDDDITSSCNSLTQQLHFHAYNAQRLQIRMHDNCLHALTLEATCQCQTDRGVNKYSVKFLEVVLTKFKIILSFFQLCHEMSRQKVCFGTIFYCKFLYLLSYLVANENDVEILLSFWMKASPILKNF